MTVGIQRIYIVDKVTGRGAYRFGQAQPYHSHVNQIYRYIFNLLPDIEYTPCTSDQKLARYDIEFGVDVLLNFLNGQTATIQEKILHTTYSTVTVEEYNDPINGVPGDWFSLKCDFYFVGYSGARAHLDRWILLDWDKVKIFSEQIKWRIKPNTRDGAKANFRYAQFTSFPPQTVIASYFNKKFTANIPCHGPIQYQFIQDFFEASAKVRAAEAWAI